MPDHRLALEPFLSEYFAERGWKWSLQGKGKVSPTESDFRAALDLAAQKLYDEEVGTRLEVGNLIIIKHTRGFDVYVRVDSF